MSKRKLGGNQHYSRKQRLNNIVETGDIINVIFMKDEESFSWKSVKDKVQLERRDNPKQNFGFYIKGTDMQIPINCVTDEKKSGHIYVDLSKSLIQNISKY